jgi:hypothetical protein
VNEIVELMNASCVMLRQAQSDIASKEGCLMLDLVERCERDSRVAEREFVSCFDKLSLTHSVRRILDA